MKYLKALCDLAIGLYQAVAEDMRIYKEVEQLIDYWCKNGYIVIKRTRSLRL